MARIRSIHPQARKSGKLAELSDGAERTFWRLITECDDAGRTEDNATLLSATLYPLVSRIDPPAVEGHLGELEAVGMIHRYERDGHTYLQVHDFTDWQKPRRPNSSKIPPPDGAETDAVRNSPDTSRQCPEQSGHVQTVSGTVWNSPDMSRREPEPEPEPELGIGGGESVRTDDDADASSPPPDRNSNEATALFERFWDSYPNHPKSGKAGGGAGKHQARQLFDALTAPEKAACMTAAAHYREWCERPEGEYPAHATNWLRNRRWEDWQTPAAPPENSGNNEVSDVSELYRRKPFRPDSSGTDRGVM